MKPVFCATAIYAFRGKRQIVLKYLVDSTIQLSAMMIIVGAILGYVRNAYGEKAGKLMRISVFIAL